MPLARRSKPKAVTKTPASAPEPETNIGEEAVNVASKTGPTLGKCKNCKTHAAHNAVSLLCYNCGKEAAGFVFDAGKLIFVKKGK